ncbi:MAG: hypothetical protein K0R73_430 [Candidatus Midichloriaceae bacterium]|jgi:hypothetical protein|nr:hypothetical protein [Candidatus Midichloriaceae bacterium]
MTKGKITQTIYQNATKQVIAEQKKKMMQNLSGSRDENFTQTLVNQTIGTLWLAQSNPGAKETKIDAMFVAMSGAKPNDELEGMLVGQMIALHSASMECFRRAMLPDQDFEVRQASLSQGNKLSRSYAILLDTLDRYRGKGPTEQKVTVEHVNVYKGGQAIVGNVKSRENQ